MLNTILDSVIEHLPFILLVFGLFGLHVYLAWFDR